MSDPYIGEIKMFAGNFAPRGFALCEGQLLAISLNSALFSLLGTIYGGDGRTTFGLPDLRGRLPIHYGQGPGLSNRNIGSITGEERVTLNSNQIPAHNHSIKSTNTVGNVKSGGTHLAAGNIARVYSDNASSLNPLHSSSVTYAGGNQAHNNIMPFACINFIIALVGVYPSRN